MDWAHVGEIVLAFVVGAIIVGTIFMCAAIVYIFGERK